MIKVENLRKAYGDLLAVNGLSFEVARGETFGLLGPNGAGKTTTILMLAGSIHSDEGSINLNGQSDPTQSEVRRQIGVAPQSLSLYDELSGEENLTFFGRLYGLSGAGLKERVVHCLDLVGLTERKDDYIGTYSGGMKRRLNLACALVHDPPILFLDEPTAGVDPQSRNHLFDQIEKLTREGRTILYTTHYMEEAQRLCDRIAIMDHGRILASGTVDELIAKHGGQSVVIADLEKPPTAGVSLPGIIEGTTLRVESDRPFEVAARLNASGVSIRTLKIDQPDLETVFLSLTGRRLRD